MMIRLLPLILFATLGAFFAARLLHTPPAAVTATQAPALTLPDFALPILGAEKILSNKDFSAYPVTVINVFASWCTPCRAELPVLQLLKDQTGVRMIGLYWQDTPQRITPWLEQYHAPFDAVIGDRDGAIAVSLGLRGVPESYVVDSRGAVRFHHSGPLTQEMLEQTLLPLISSLQSAPITR